MSLDEAKSEGYGFWREFKTEQEAIEGKNNFPAWKEGKVVKVDDQHYPYQLLIRERQRT